MSRFFERNGTLKVLSVIIAVILWLYAVSELNPETTNSIYDIPIEIKNEDALKDKQLTLAADPTAKVNIRIRGLVNDIRKVNEANVKAVLDLENIDWTGTRQVPLNIEGLLPREVKLDKIPEVAVTVNKIITKKIPIEVKISGDTAANYYRHDVISEPESITIYGAESLVDSVVQGVVQVKLDNEDNTFEQSLAIRLVDGAQRIVDSKYVNMRQNFAMVKIPIYPVKGLSIVPNVVGKPIEGYELDGIEVEPSSITVNGYASVLNPLTEISTDVIDIQDADTDVQATVDLTRMEGVYVNPGQPTKIKVIVRISERVIDKNFTLDNIVFSDLTEGYNFEVLSEPITVRVTGPYNLVYPMTVEAFAPNVDLTGLEPGIHDVALNLNKPTGLQEVKTSSDKVKVNISAEAPPEP